MAEFRVPLDGYDDTAQSNIWNTDEAADSTAAQAYAARLNAHFVPLGSDFTFVAAPASPGTDAGRLVGPDGTPLSFVANSTTFGQTLSQPATANRPPSDSRGVFQNAANLILTGPLVAESDGVANPRRGVAAGGDSPASAGETAMPGILNDLGSSAGSGGVTTDIVSVASSGLVFHNTFEPSVTAAFKNDIITAEQTLATLWTNSVALNLEFQAEAEGTNTFLATNNWPSFVDVTYVQLKSALASHEFSSYAQAAVASLPGTDPNPAGGADWALPEAYARMLGLSSSTPATDDTVTLNTSYNWTYGQDVINALEHEISEGGMGRVGGLGDQNGVWSTMDLFRYSAPGVRDYTDGRDGATTDFSYNGTQLSSSAGLSFNNEYSGATKKNAGDTADFTQLDVFGVGNPGETNTLSLTNMEIMDVLGWDPAPQSGTPSITAPATATVRVGQAGAIAGVSISESPTTSSETFTVTLVDKNGLLSATGTGVSGSGTTSLTISGSLSQVNSDLATLTDKDGKTPSDTITVNASDSNGGTASLRSIAVAVNTPSSDFNGDGYSDFLYQNSSGEAYIRWYNGGGSLGNPGRSWHPISTGDFNGDGLADILWQNSTGEAVIWEMNGITVIGSGSLGNPGPSWHAIATGDFNGDGRSDILWQNSSGEVVIWEMNETGLIGGGSLGNPGPSWHAIGSGDFNGDGRSDILWQNSTGEVVIWELNGTSVIGGGSLGNPGPSWHAIGTGDFNKDDRSDILWQNDSGEVAIWELNGTNVIGGGSLGNPGPSWRAIGTGDYNGDGFSDIRFQNSSGEVVTWDMNGTSVIGGSSGNSGPQWHLEGDSSTYPAASVDLAWQSDGNSIFWQNDNGQAVVWVMNGTTVIGGGSPGSPDPSWHEKAAGDFNGDRNPDILWQNDSGEVVIWELNGASVIGGGSLSNPGPSWHTIGSGDFNGDGKSDILWQNDSGEVVIWQLNGTSVIGGGSLGNPGPSWHTIGSGDFNGDGKSDILWQNDTGEVVIWGMNGTSVIGGGSLGNLGPSWHAEGSGDFNGDGKSDILWQNDSGEAVIWEMNGTSVIGGASLGNPGPDWHVMGTGDYTRDGKSDILLQSSSGDVAIWEMNGTGIIGGGNIASPGPTWHV